MNSKNYCYLVTVHQHVEAEHKRIIQHNRLISVKNLKCFGDGCLSRRADCCSKLVFRSLDIWIIELSSVVIMEALSG